MKILHTVEERNIKVEYGGKEITYNVSQRTKRERERDMKIRKRR